MRRIHTQRHIDASPGEVWRLLTDFAAYPEWNPLVRKVEGEAAPGAKVRMTIARPDKNGALGSMRIRFVRWEPERALAWRGNIWPIFDGTHWFRLTPEGDGTRLEHGENMRGLYPLLMGERGVARMAPHYQAVNEALARRLAGGA